MVHYKTRKSTRARNGKRSPVYRRDAPVIAGRIPNRSQWLRKPGKKHVQPQTSKIFLKGSSMVGSPGPRQLLIFRPTKAMQARGHMPATLRFYHASQAERLGLDFALTPRQDWINARRKELKRVGLL